MLISCGCAYWLIIYHALPYAQICRFQVKINRSHPVSNAMNTFDISYNGTPIANMGCYSSFDIYFFCHDGTPYWWDVMTYCLSWWNSLRGCHDLLFIMMELLQGMSWSGTRLQFSQILVEILCGDVHLLQFLSEDIKSNEQYKLQKKTKCKSTNQYRTNTKTFVIMWNMTFQFFYSFHGLMWHLWCCFQRDIIFSLWTM